MALKCKYITEDEKILPYLSTLIENEYLYSRGNLVDNETFISIVHRWIDWYEKSIEKTIENTHSVFSKLYADTGYQSIATNWIDWGNKIKHERWGSVQHITDGYRSNFVACIAHLYQANNWGKKYEPYRSGASGCCLVCSFNISWVDSDTKGIKKVCISDITMGLELHTGQHDEIDVYSE